MNSARLNRQQRRAAAARREWVPLQRATLIPLTDEEIEARALAGKEIRPDLDLVAIRQMVIDASTEAAEVWKNDQYQVHVVRWEPLKINDRTVPIIQLSIRRLDRAPARDWRDFQRIKNQLLGKEIEAIELYPAESRLVDTATQYHLWSVNDPAFRFPFGYDAGRTVSSASGAGSVQRPLDEEEPSYCPHDKRPCLPPRCAVCPTGSAQAETGA